MLRRQPKRKSLANALSLSKITDQSGELANLFQKADQLENFSAIVKSCLPEIFIGKIAINGVQNQALILTCNSASIATRLRMQEKEIIQNLARKLPAKQIRQIKTKIRPRKFSSEPAKQERSMSKENAQLLAEEAGQTKDKKLRDALSRLAAHGNKQSET